jgi:drug/metabolite transporter (DMT)-like permease
MSSIALAFVVGIIAPGIQTVGLFVWQNRWKGGALELNAFKGVFGGVFILAIALATTRTLAAYTTKAVGFLILSSVLGIVIADTWWLLALARIGARKMIAIDSIKPFLAIIFGSYILGDSVPALGIAGVFITAFGVALINLERAKEPSLQSTSNSVELATQVSPIVKLDGLADTLTEPDEKTAAQLQTTMQRLRAALGAVDIAYTYAVGNVVFDVYAAVLTVKYHEQLTAADVNLIRFGFAGVALTAALGVRRALALAHLGGFCRPAESVQRERAAAATMSQRDWGAVAGGVLFVTVAAPLASTWVLFQLPLAVALTLGSLTPLWSLPVAHCTGEVVSAKAVAGALMATAGVVVLVS